jgi:SAM-dependent methyltransferase
MDGKKIIDLGCGRSKLPRAVCVDFMDLPGVDFVTDLNKSLPFENESFDIVYSNQVFEHIQNMIELVGECHRLLKTGGLLIVHVPYFRSSWAAIDPTHIRQFSINSLHYFVRGTWQYENYRFNDTGFSKIQCYLDANYSAGPLRYIFSRMALRWPHTFENSILSFLYPFQTLTFVLEK